MVRLEVAPQWYGELAKRLLQAYSEVGGPSSRRAQRIADVLRAACGEKSP